jgi:exosortase A
VLAAIGAAWTASHWMAMALPSQVAMVAMVPVVIAAVFGIAWVRALLFPLAFLFFAVPFGESLVPVLMDWTADFTVAALKLSGVPVYRDGLHFDIPSGKWSVVDSCSGIRYLFACVSVSALYSWTIYRGTTRRLLFVGFAIVIAIVANWVRAYAIVMLGHLSNNQIATGADHLVYGGIFFAVIMALVFALGAVWREDAPAASSGGVPAAVAGPSNAVAEGRPLPVPRAGATMAAAAMLLLWPAVSILSAEVSDRPVVSMPDLLPRAGWQRVGQPVASWRPVLRNPAAASSQAFAKGDQVVGIHVGLFGRSTPESKLATAMNRFVEPDGQNPHWKLSQLGKAQAGWGGQPVEVRTGVLVGNEARLLAWQLYWVDGAVTADPIRASALQLLARLQGRSEVSAWITVYAPDGSEPGAAASALKAFVTDMSSSIDATLGRPAVQSSAVRD